MEEAVVGALVGAAIQTVLQNLVSPVLQNLLSDLGLNKDLEKLKDSLDMVKDFVDDAQTKQVTDKSVKRWLEKLENEAYKADAVLDELHYEALRKKTEKQNKTEKKVKAFFSHLNPIAFRMKMANKISGIRKNLELINQEATGFGLQTRFATGSGSNALAGRETDSFNADPIVLGRDDDISKIVDMLTASPTEPELISVLPIVGMGGLGKTTLARLVFHHEKIKTHFEKQFWVCMSKMSENFDAKTLFTKILELLTGQNFQLGSREVLLKKLQEGLGDKRYLLILDDIWNDEEEDKWSDFINSFSGISSVRGNAIVVTTRSQRVASMVQPLHIHKLESLSEDNCWSIIKAKTFKGGQIPSEFETTGRNIAQRCRGLPLAAKVVGGLLCNKSKDEWLAIQETWLSNFVGDANPVMKILKLSFDHLSPSSLKKCFAICSIFPKGAEIGKEELIEFWIAEGSLQIDQKSNMDTMGDKFFNLLLEKSLLEEVERDDYGNITYCKMHDLVHDLASNVLGNKNKAGYFIGDETCATSNERARCPRTLLFEGKLSDTMPLGFKCLHTLILVNEEVEELPIFIGKLIHLRYLDISHTRIQCLPNSIGKLYHLQTLRAVTTDERERYLRKLPNTLKNLISLRHLHIPEIELPPEIGRLTSLQTLPFFQVGHEKGCRILELGSLKNLKGKLEISNLENVDDKEEAKSACLFEKSNIFKLKFVWSESREGESNDENVLEGLEPHLSLKSLEIDGFKGNSFPSWALKMRVREVLEGHWTAYKNLMEIRLTNCRECEQIPMLGHLPNLKSLYLRNLSSVRSVGSSFYGINNNGVCKERITLFPALQRLELSKMENLAEWVEIELPIAAETQLCEVEVFPRLEYLKLINCHQLMSAPSHFPCLKELEIEGMEGSFPLANICGSYLITLARLQIDSLNGLICLPDGLFCKNHNLSYLGIKNCPNLTHLVPCLQGGGASLRELMISHCKNLRELPDDLHSLSNLERLYICDCPNLKSVTYPSGGQSQGFTSLRDLYISRCAGLTNLPSEMLESCAPSLRSLRLNGLSSLMNLAMVIGCLQKMPLLTDLYIRDVPKPTDFPVVTGSRLRSLSIFPFSDSSDLVSFKETVDGIIFQGLQSLRQLTLYGMEHWDSLPDQLQNLTALSHLELNEFGIEALPEWFGNLSSLKELYLDGCKKLRRLPSKEAMQRLTKLTHLDIFECPVLKLERCNIEQQSSSPHDSDEWPKISHISQVYVDGIYIQSHGHR